MALSAEQRAGVWRAKLHTLARDHFGRDGGIDYDAPWGAAVDNDGIWTALIEVSPQRSFGQALVLAMGHQASSLDLLVNDDAGHVARRATLFDPSPTVFRVDGTAVVPAEPSAHAAVQPAAALRADIGELLSVDNVDIIVEHGVTIGECKGLEVARVTGEGAEQRLDVGVGAYDQGAFAAINPDMTPTQALGEVVSQVMAQRHGNALTHPLNRLARERWIRHEILADPSSIGLAGLSIVEPITVRDGIKATGIASAVGVDNADARVLVACSIGIDLDAVPAATDLAARHQANRIVIVLPDQDRHSAIEAIATRSRVPIEFITAPTPWP